MKAHIITSRLNMFLTSLLDGLTRGEKVSPGIRSGKPPAKRAAIRPPRKDFFYYMLVMDADTREVVGHLSDIGTGGFKLDTRNPVPINKDFRLCLHLPKEVSDRPFMVFGARSRWCRVDPLDPFTYNVGFQLIHFAPEDLDVFIRMMEKYGRDYEKRNLDLRRSNRW